MTRIYAMAAFAAVLVAGCCGLEARPPDIDLAMAALAQWKAGIIGQDLERIMAPYSDSYRTSARQDKAALRAYFRQLRDEGYLESARVSFDAAETWLQENEAQVRNVDVEAAGWKGKMSFVLRREAGLWQITNQDWQVSAGHLPAP